MEKICFPVLNFIIYYLRQKLNRQRPSQKKYKKPILIHLKFHTPFRSVRTFTPVTLNAQFNFKRCAVYRQLSANLRSKRFNTRTRDKERRMPATYVYCQRDCIVG